MFTENGPEWITFQIVSTSGKVWEAHYHEIDTSLLTNDWKYIDPGDVTMPGNFQSGSGWYGWNSDNIPDKDGPFLGRGTYQI